VIRACCIFDLFANPLGVNIAKNRYAIVMNHIISLSQLPTSDEMSYARRSRDRIGNMWNVNVMLLVIFSLVCHFRLRENGLKIEI